MCPRLGDPPARCPFLCRLGRPSLRGIETPENDVRCLVASVALSESAGALVGRCQLRENVALTAIRPHNPKVLSICSHSPRPFNGFLESLAAKAFCPRRHGAAMVRTAPGLLPLAAASRPPAPVHLRPERARASARAATRRDYSLQAAVDGARLADSSLFFALAGSCHPWSA